MRHIATILFVAAVFFVACNNETKTAKEASTDTAAKTTDTTTTTAAPVLDSATIQKNWEAYMTPSDLHRLMSSWVGEWSAETKMWHVPNMEPEVSTGTSSTKMVLGGRYQVSNHKGSMMGQPFEGMSTLAYDNGKKEFINTWIDNVGTGLMVLKGHWNDDTKTLSLSGNCVDPTSGTGREFVLRESYKVIDDKTHVMEMYGPDASGKEFKMMEITFKRKS